MAKVIKAWKGHYTVEFKFRDKFYYMVHIYTNSEVDTSIYEEAEFLLADDPEPIFRYVDTSKESGIYGELPMGMNYEVIGEAMQVGKEAAESGTAHLTLGW